MSQDVKIFADGFSFKRNENAPEFVVGRLSMKVSEAVAFLKEHDRNDWVNLNIKKARSGNHYVELDTFEPKTKEAQAPTKTTKKSPPPAAVDSADEADLPF